MEVQRTAVLEVALHGFFGGADQPVLSDAALGIGVLFIASVPFGRAGGQYFHCQVRSAADSIFFDFALVALE